MKLYLLFTQHEDGLDRKTKLSHLNCLDFQIYTDQSEAELYLESAQSAFGKDNAEIVKFTL